MSTIIATTTPDIWEQSKNKGEYVNSTIDTLLTDVGFIHCTSPDQTLDMLNRHFTKRDDVLLLLIDLDRVKSEVKFESALSGRQGLFPHIYGPLNVDAVYETIRPEKDESGNFKMPKQLDGLQK